MTDTFTQSLIEDLKPELTPPPVPEWDKPGRLIREELELYTEAEVARALSITPTTLALWRSKKQGPDYCRLGKRVYYTKWALKTWVRIQQVCPTRGYVITHNFIATPEGDVPVNNHG